MIRPYPSPTLAVVAWTTEGGRLPSGLRLGAAGGPWERVGRGPPAPGSEPRPARAPYNGIDLCAGPRPDNNEDYFRRPDPVRHAAATIEGVAGGKAGGEFPAFPSTGFALSWRR
jgi:hypothetical protein